MLMSCNIAALLTGSGLAIAPLADIEVRKESDGTLATIYSDEPGSAGITQPGFKTDSSGRALFYAAGIDRGYSILVTKAGGGESYTFRNVPMGTLQYLDQTVLLTKTFLDRMQRRARWFAALNLP